MIWKKPEIIDGQPNIYGWIVKKPENFKLGNNTDIGFGTYIQAEYGIEIEDNVMIGSGCSVYSSNTIDNTKGKIIIKEGARIGSGTVILPRIDGKDLIIGKESKIGALSLVKHNIPEKCTAFGIPAKQIIDSYYKKVSEADKIYFAGLFDGEGTVDIDKQYSLRVGFELTYLPVLNDIEKLFGGSIYKRDMETRIKSLRINKAKENGLLNPDKWKQEYIYRLLSKEAWIFLKAIEPYCREKKDQALTGIEYFNRRSNLQGRIISKSQKERCEYYRKKLQELKKQNNGININNNEIELPQKRLF